MIIADCAGRGDNAQLCALVERSSLAGAIGLSYCRAPDFFSACEAQARFSQVMVTREQGRIGSLCVRSINTLFVNGAAVEFGYLHTLRADPDRSNNFHFARNFLQFRKLHKQDNRARAYLATTIEAPGRRETILGRLANSFDCVLDLGRLTTYALPLKSNRTVPKDNPPGLIRGTPATMPAIAAFLNACGCKRQFYPAYTLDDFDRFSRYGFKPENFYCIVRGNAIVAALAVWDHSSVKQLKVRYYRGLLRYARGAINLGLQARGLCPLPKVGNELQCAYACCIAVQDDDPALLSLLINSAKADLDGSGRSFFCIGFHESDPLSAAMKKRTAFSYASRVHCFAWADGAELCRRLASQRIPYLEVGML